MAVDPHNSTPAPNNSKRLESWKEIASHIGRDERTAMRWEALGMPVHRAPGERRGRVYAFTHEIDAWIAAHDSGLHSTTQLENAWNGPKEPRANSDALANGANTALPNGAPAPNSAPPEIPPAPSVASRQHPNPRPGRGLIFLGALAVLAALSSAYFWFRPGQPVRHSVQAGELSTYDANGRLVWKYRFPFGVAVLPSLPPQYAARFVDLDNDGSEEFLFVVNPDPQLETGYLICFDRRGRERWRRELKEIVHFGDDPQAPPHVPQNFVITYPQPGAAPHIWLYSHQRTWMASEIVKLDSNGKRLGAFWNPGHVNVLRETTLNGRKVLLVGGTHNESYAGFLAAVDYDNPTGCSPAATERYKCKEYPVQGFVHYLLFSPSELGRVTQERAHVRQINFRPDGRYEVIVTEDVLDESLRAGVSYLIDENFELLETEVLDGYQKAHNQMESKRMLDHPVDRLKEGDALRMRRWLSDRFSDPIAPKKPRLAKARK